MDSRPTTAAEVADVVAEAAREGRTLEIRGAGSRADFGSRTSSADILDMRGLSGVVDYDPPELVLTVRAGTPLAEIEALLAAHSQMLAFEPCEAGPLFGSAAGSTIGGVVAAGLAGSRRLTRGSVRDHLLGFTAVSGRAQAFVAGGKVVKNVTGYDLPKLMAGSWGRLAALVELTFKVVPAPETVVTRLIHGLSPQDASTAMACALRSRAEVAAAAYAPAGRWGALSATAFRFEGIAPSIAARSRMLDEALPGVLLVDAEPGSAPWAAFRSLDPLSDATALWRAVVPAKAMPELGRAIDAIGGRWLADWGGGLVWTDWLGDASAFRALLDRLEGHAMLIRGPEALRSVTPALHPLPDALARLNARVRSSFDPSGVFETGRFGDTRRAD